ncbi:tagatose 1,6-diphosphate aldolase [Shinella zoogloeoides]|uniref:tagatose 1,6-diphosphate aldolase n=1 Tax=Shinella zoogloeoides TaxID=352475 RepID=UPI0028A8333B|nr:tagatose 1,6-diphosphate aldolase [Shinella zoogloeoides]
MELSAGKFWCMRRLADKDGFFKMVAVDQRPGVEALVSERLGLSTAPYEKVGEFKKVLIEELSGGASAMLLDPGYAYPYGHGALDPGKGLLITLEQWACEETSGGRKTFAYPDWSVEKIKRLGADGVKVMLWYRPDASPEVLRHQQDFVEMVGRECRKHDIAFLLEPLVYPLGAEGSTDSYSEDKNKRPEMVIETVEEFKKERYGIDIFKLESPIPAKVIVAPEDNSDEMRETQAWFDQIDKRLDRPWVMLSAGAGMEPFRRILTYAFRAGASGYLAGRAIWWSSTEAYPDLAGFRAKLREGGLPYVDTIQASLKSYGKPWYEKPAFGGNPKMACAQPDFYAVYPGLDD